MSEFTSKPVAGQPEPPDAHVAGAYSQGCSAGEQATGTSFSQSAGMGQSGAINDSTPSSEDRVWYAPPETERRGREVVGHFLGSLSSMAVTIVIAIFVITFIVQAFQIPSESMERTLLIGDYLLVDKVHNAKGGVWSELEPYAQIKRGDIVVFRYPVNPQQHFVKRVIGLPGDHVRLISKRVYVNGSPLGEPYTIYRSNVHDIYRDDFPNPDYLNANADEKWWLQMRYSMQGKELVVPKDQYFVLGDNRDESLDSRYWGFVPRENIIGRPLVIYFSMQRPVPISFKLSGFADQVHTFTYNLSHLRERIRWQRCLRLIK